MLYGVAEVAAMPRHKDIGGRIRSKNVMRADYGSSTKVKPYRLSEWTVLDGASARAGWLKSLFVDTRRCLRFFV